MNTTEILISSAEEIMEEEGVPRSVVQSMKQLIDNLNSEGDIKIKKDKGIYMLEDVVNNDNIDPYIRTQLLDIVAHLEQL